MAQKLRERILFLSEFQSALLIHPTGESLQPPVTPATGESSQSPVTPATGDLAPSSGLYSTCTHVHILLLPPHTHTHNLRMKYTSLKMHAGLERWLSC